MPTVAEATLLLVEDGTEYRSFFELFLADPYTVVHTQNGAAALSALAAGGIDAIVLDMRFDRTPTELLLGDVDEVTRRHFGRDRDRALRYLQDQQGTLILETIRQAGHVHPALFISDMPPRRALNLRKLYGAVAAVPGFDAAAIRSALRDLGVG